MFQNSGTCDPFNAFTACGASRHHGVCAPVADLLYIRITDWLPVFDCGDVTHKGTLAMRKATEQ